ncbi:hypothetical protein GGR56DRAFT_425038 [Xylariaceae sp. FL0804]|nr:hypothetical protein GGR56DRAFT_425038 [Xylariaceae sp. FL0804]
MQNCRARDPVSLLENLLALESLLGGGGVTPGVPHWSPALGDVKSALAPGAHISPLISFRPLLHHPRRHLSYNATHPDFWASASLALHSQSTHLLHPLILVATDAKQPYRFPLAKEFRTETMGGIPPNALNNLKAKLKAMVSHPEPFSTLCDVPRAYLPSLRTVSGTSAPGTCRPAPETGQKAFAGTDTLRNSSTRKRPRRPTRASPRARPRLARLLLLELPRLLRPLPLRLPLRLPRPTPFPPPKVERPPRFLRRSRTLRSRRPLTLPVRNLHSLTVALPKFGNRLECPALRGHKPHWRHCALCSTR